MEEIDIICREVSEVKVIGIATIGGFVSEVGD